MELKSNLKITVRERGKIVMRREGHNIWLNEGRTYLAALISYNSFAPDVFQNDLRVSRMGFGIGSDRSNLFSRTDPLLGVHYPGTNVYTDTSPAQFRIERPVRVAWLGLGASIPAGVYPNLVYPATDVFSREVDPGIVEPVSTSRTFTRTFTTVDFNGPGAFPGFFPTIPLSEIALFARGPASLYGMRAVAYDTFEPIPKTQNFGFEVQWVVRF